MSSGIFLGLGSNLGDREQNLIEAKRLLFLQVLHSSSIYETEPVEYLNQPWFLNVVVEVEEGLTARELLVRCQEVEHRMGRQRNIPKGPRKIDLDVLFYNNLVLNDPDLIIPHPSIPERRFVLAPINEIAPDFTHPVLGKTIRQLLLDCSDHSIVRKLEW
jgi:2-amino-4-hydroxy-6-hydroxymethyldihydropteridine diphosphokinase